MTHFYYTLDRDGVDDVFLVWRGKECLAEFPFWYERDAAEARAQRLIELLAVAKRGRRRRIR